MMSKRLITQYMLIALLSIHQAVGQSYFGATANGTLTVEPSSFYEFLVSGLTWDQSYYLEDELDGDAAQTFGNLQANLSYTEGGGDDPEQCTYYGDPTCTPSLFQPSDQDDLFLYIKVTSGSGSMTPSSIQIPGIQSVAEERDPFYRV